MDLDQVLALRRLLYANGYQPVEVKTGTKVPARPAWQTKQGVSPPRPDALSTGIASRGLCPLDIDVDDANAVARIIAIIHVVADHTALIRTRADSAHCMLLYRAPDGTEPKKRVIKLGDLGKIEILGNGQQFVAYGIHPSGAEFEWLDSGPDVIKRDDVPILTPEHEAEIRRRLCEEFGAEPEPEPAPQPVSSSRLSASASAVDPSNIGERERSYFAAALAGEAKALAEMPKGNRNNALNKSAFRMGQLVGAGYGARSDAEAELIAAARAAGLPDWRITKTLASGLSAGIAEPAGALPDREGYGEAVSGINIDGIKAPGKVEAAPTSSAEMMPAANEDDDDLEDEVETTAPIDDSLTRFGGVLGELVDWITDCGSTGNRILSLSAALPLMGTLLGRRMATPTRGGGMLELYAISLFPSGGGKSDAARCVHRLMDVLGLANQHRAQTKGFRSGAALAAHICRKPLSLLIVDEISDWFSTFLNAKSNHLLDIEREMKVVWGTNFSSYMSDESMGRAGETVNGPCFSIYGMTTPDGLFRVIKSREVMNGFVNRLTVINAGASGEQREPLENFRHPPERLLAGLRDMYTMGMKGSGNMGGFVDKNAANDPEPFIVQWQDKAASDFYIEFEREFREREQSEGDLGKIFSRTAFQAVKMATIRACGDFSPVTLEHMQWGAALARQSAELFRSELAGKMLDPLTAGELLQKIAQQFRSPTRRGVELMAKYGYMTLPRRFLWQNLKHHVSRHPGEFDNALKAMETNGELKIDKHLVTYRARRRAA